MRGRLLSASETGSGKPYYRIPLGLTGPTGFWMEAQIGAVGGGEGSFTGAGTGAGAGAAIAGVGWRSRGRAPVAAQAATMMTKVALDILSIRTTMHKSSQIATRR